MNRDKKIGLVLGLLLIGTVAVIFFRNEPEPEKQAPRLENPEALAEELEDTEGPKPYLQDSSFATDQDQKFVEFDKIETDETFSAFLDSSSEFDKRSSYEELPATPAKNRSLTQEQNWFEVRSRPLSSKTKREAATNNRQTAGRPSPQQAWNSHSNRPVEKVRPERTTSASEIRIHRVRPGETLSSLATYYLGSDTRYMELYQFNKDVLKNPNRLQVGMTLRIPPAKNSRVVSAGTVKTRSVSTIPTPQRAPRLSKDRASSVNSQGKRRSGFPRFLPIRRSPFSPGRQRRNN